jgi:sigma-B regulation protein RsbU (phosphoserine phosphatase)
MSAATFMSLFLAVLDPTTGSLLYASAGHNPPLLHRAGGGIEELERTGPILGAMPGVQFRASAPIQLAPGDVLTLYTDGIYEARDGRDEMYGEDRFTASLERQASAGLDAKGILAGLLEDLDGFRGPQPLEDDITCLVVKAV